MKLLKPKMQVILILISISAFVMGIISLTQIQSEKDKNYDKEQSIIRIFESIQETNEHNEKQIKSLFRNDSLLKEGIIYLWDRL